MGGWVINIGCVCVCVCESDRNQKIDNSEAKNVKIERKGKKGEKNPQPETVSESLKVYV